MCKAGKVIKQRLKEPSTWSGIAAIGAALFGVPAEAANAIVQGGIVIAGGLAVMMGEKAQAK